ncbi:MAG: S8 family serine peptidase [Bacteroidales bacterium]|nr:S8 family serine peptidase [Bacteroidales bacterium]
MKRILTYLGAIVLTAAAACSCHREEMPSAPSAQTPGSLDDVYTPGMVLVQFDEPTAELVEKAVAAGSLVTKSSELDNVLDGMGIKSLRRVFPDEGRFDKRARREGLHRFYYVEFDGSTPSTKAASDIRDIPGVVSAHAEMPVRTRKFNDPFFSSQWHYVNPRYAGADINIQKVWDEFTVGDPKVIVAVLDEAVYLDHEDLSANVVPAGLDMEGGSWNFNNDTPVLVPYEGHGTHIAGTIAAVNNNGKGVCGVAGGDAARGIPGVRILSCQIFDVYGRLGEVYRAMRYAADNGAVILQCSWGFSPDLNGDGYTSDSEKAAYRSYTINDLPEYKAALDYFIKYAGCDEDGNQLPDSPMKGGIVFFAAGNDDFDFDPLVSYDQVVSVGAFGATGYRSSYSNWGDWVDIAAPGGDGKQGIFSTLLNNTYGGGDVMGTSMACPHVSGVAALLVSYFGGEGFTADDCKKRLIRGADPNYFTSAKKIGRKLDAYASFIYDVNAPVKDPVIEWTGDMPSEMSYKENLEFTFSVSDPNNALLSVTATGSGLVTSLEDGKVTVLGAESSPGERILTVTARNDDGASASITHSLTIWGNRKPVIVKQPAPVLLKRGGEPVETDIEGMFSDPDGDNIQMQMRSMDENIARAELEGNTLRIVPVSAGITSIRITATDEVEANETVVLDVVVKNPDAPLDVYPSPATTEVYVRTDTQTAENVTVTVYSSTGAKVAGLSEEASAFSPVRVDVSSLAPGAYTLVAEYSGRRESKRFVKI